MTRVTIVADDTREVSGVVVAGRVLVASDALPAALGWTLAPEGLCRDDVCVPVRDRDALRVGERVDLTAAAGALGRACVVDADAAADAAIVAIALDHEQRVTALQSLVAPDVTLHDLDGVPHRLSEWRGRKRLLHAFSSW
jgi:hypothetical protein